MQQYISHTQYLFTNWQLDDTRDLPLKRGAEFFNAGCIEQVFSLKSWKKIWRRSVLSFSRKRNYAYFNSKKWLPETMFPKDWNRPL